MITTIPTLIDHIRKINAKTLQWISEGEGRGACTFTEDLAHWAASGITTPAEFDHYNSLVTFYESAKDKRNR